MQASSSRRESKVPAENVQSDKKKKKKKKSSSIGCMSGILHLISRHHHSHSRKRLLPVAKKETTTNKSPKRKVENEFNEVSTTVKDELRCNTPRSPTLPSEIRRPSAADPPLADSPRSRASALVARLMGLDDVAVRSPDSAAEKRRKLLGALDQCDEDLKSLKRIIDAVRVAESRRKTVASVVVESEREEEEDRGSDRNGLLGCGDLEIKGEKCSPEVNGEQPSPVSVLDAVRSPTNQETRLQNGGPSKKIKHTTKACASPVHPITTEGLLPVSEQKKCELFEDFRWVRRGMEGGRLRHRLGWKRSEKMMESVDEVWDNGLWEERWELERVELQLERGVLGDLVEELVWELQLLGCCNLYGDSVPRGKCRKRLSF